ncbi:transient receptor potential cation channel protein painless-like [Agrilus planipennis]|uniref:Transient receptor potential cation channel protein painless-like n=1 Tax=Agrilus planipennis TaxID=224129 RepID=A0A1W4XWE3_AGRPL|nr:transient receptor potential cation channel protein painless-like [Agrilus planipennis]
MSQGEYELHRTDSLCPTPLSRLFDLVKSNRSTEIRRLVNEHGKALLSQIYDHPFYKTIVQIACSNLASQITSETLQTLIDLGGNLYSLNEHFDNKQCLHFAAESGIPEILKVILRNINEKQINSQCDGGCSALHCLVRFSEKDDDDQEECVKLLVQCEQFDVNKIDDKNLTAIYYAARKGNRKVVSAILNFSYHPVDIDTHKFRGKSARDFIQEKQLYNGSLPMVDDSRHANNIDPINVLFSYLNDLKEDEFVRSGHLSETTANGDNGRMTLLQLASSKGLTNAVEKLLELGAIPDKVTERTPKTPIEMAAEEGYYEIVKILINTTSMVPTKALGTSLKMADVISVDPKRDYQRCCELLLEQPIDINSVNNESILRYAVCYGGSEVTLKLLRAGASLACKNNYGIMAVEEIDSTTMEKHLDECLEVNLDKNVEAENFEAVFNYKTLMPPTKFRASNKNKEVNSFSVPEDLEAANTLFKEEVEEFTLEMEVVNFMSKSAELRHLLTHPVITSFLYMKWLRLSKFFYINLAVYVLFCLYLFLYVFMSYNIESPEKSSPNVTLTIILSILFAILCIREIFQMFLTPNTYFFECENWLELILVFLTALILFQKSPSEFVRKQVSAFVILVAAFDIVLMIGQHPKMATNIVMLKTVSCNFLKFFLWYAILIIAFAMSFHVLFKNEDGNESKQSNKTLDVENEDDKEQDFFVDPAVSLFKTFVMLTGEFDASDINFNKFPVTGHLIFALFIFMIAIILFNLLNGLAVSDTQMIKSNAELVGHIARIEHITRFENMFLGKVIPNSLLEYFEEKCCCVTVPLSKLTFLRPFAHKVCLFPRYLKGYQLKVLPNQFGRVVLPNENFIDDDSMDTTCINDCRYIYLDRKTVKRTRNLIREKKLEIEKQRRESSIEQKQNEIITQQKQQIEEIRKEQKIIMHKLEAIINNMNSLTH